MAVNSAGAATKDLPLTANVDDIRVKHYMIWLTLKDNWEVKTFQGVVVIILDAVASSSNSRSLVVNTDEPAAFECVLDCCDLKVSKVEEVLCDFSIVEQLLDWSREKRFSRQLMTDVLGRPGVPLSFMLNEWSLRIHKDDVGSAKDFPRIVRIVYETTPTGASLTWTNDQCSRPCVFTQGAWINNRSLFPCQEPPVAMATWQAMVTVPQCLVVLMTGDDLPDLTTESNGWKTFYYYTMMVLPMSTLAIAVGYWKCAAVASCEDAEESVKNSDIVVECLHDNYLCYLQVERHFAVIPVRVFAVEHLLKRFVEEFGTYIRQCLKAAYHVLGPHPFRRLDILIVPENFASLGFASPHLLLVSQSLLVGDGSMAVRLAHEISHSWFGLSIGALDWTEEWLSEGFATYVEDVIHAKAMKWSLKESAERSHLRAVLRHRVLSAELENTDTELQTLRPNTGKSQDRIGSTVFVKNGMNPDKSCTQVHYLKGYFLLRHLSKCVGDDEFSSFLKEYVLQFHGQLVLSKEIVDRFFLRFRDVRLLTKEYVYANWLDNPGMPKDLIAIKSGMENQLHQKVTMEFHKWDHFNHVLMKRRKKRLKIDAVAVDRIIPDQLTLLLELLLDVPILKPQTLKMLQEAYSIDKQNPEVRHRWCELVVKHKYSSAYAAVRRFLLEDQAMGVYLYGELVLSKNAKQLHLARECFNKVEAHMDASHRTIVKEMLGMDG